MYPRTEYARNLVDGLRQRVKALEDRNATLKLERDGARKALHATHRQLITILDLSECPSCRKERQRTKRTRLA